MKFIHTADLHLGKVVCGFSMLSDQRHILKQIVSIAREEQADAVAVAGDVYDRSIPPAEAVTLFDDFLTELSEAGIGVMLVSGNHDSPERLGFAGRILEKKGLHVAGVFDGNLKKVTFQDEYGEVAFFLMPFMKPLQMKGDGEKEPSSFEEGVKGLLEKAPLSDDRNVLITHFFVVNGSQMPDTCDSETESSVGGLNQVDAGCFGAFDYTALGHLHRAQKIGGECVRYAGSPLKYSFSEVYHNKSVTIVELKEKGELVVGTRGLVPLHDMRKLKGRLQALINDKTASLGDREDYLCAVLTDEEELLNPMDTLRSVYPNTMQIVLERKLKQAERTAKNRAAAVREKSLSELFGDFYVQVTGEELTEEEQKLISALALEAQEGVER